MIVKNRRYKSCINANRKYQRVSRIYTGTRKQNNHTRQKNKHTPSRNTRIHETQVLRIHMSIALLVKVKQNNKYKKQGHLKVSVYTQNVQT